MCSCDFSSDEFIDQVMAQFDENNKLNQLFEIVLENDYRKWSAMRKIYALIDTDHYTPYPVDWTRIFTPIESMVWTEIRGAGLPFFPQFPVGKYFADFADPKKRIAIECDGAAFHSFEKDRQRNEFFASQGWSVYRISGADCNHVVDIRWDEIDEFSSESKSLVSDWLYKTAEGFMWSLACASYNGHFNHKELLQSESSGVLSSRKARY